MGLGFQAVVEYGRASRVELSGGSAMLWHVSTCLALEPSGRRFLLRLAIVGKSGLLTVDHIQACKTLGGAAVWTPALAGVPAQSSLWS